MVKYLKDWNTPINDLGGGFDVDSDCEDDSTGPSDGTVKEEDEESRAALITGSFSACVRFFVPSSRWEK